MKEEGLGFCSKKTSLKSDENYSVYIIDLNFWSIFTSLFDVTEIRTSES